MRQSECLLEKRPVTQSDCLTGDTRSSVTLSPGKSSSTTSTTAGESGGILIGCCRCMPSSGHPAEQLPTEATLRSRQPVLLSVEGTNAVEFLKRISTALRRDDASLSDLTTHDETGEVIFIPFGGGNVFSWATRFAPLGVPEFHLFDRECGTESTLRIDAARAINARPLAKATVTSKRSIENFLHPHAIESTLGVQIDVGDHEDLPLALARALHQVGNYEVNWSDLPRNDRKRLCHRAKRKLNSVVVSELTVELLQERDPDGEVIG